MDIPEAWEQFAVAEPRGVIMIVGAPDMGKSTLARHLYGRLCAEGRAVAFLDGDPGQSTLGPPATMTLALGLPGEVAFPPGGPQWRRFVGAVSPRGHMLTLVVAAARLAGAAQMAGAETVIYDTTGLVDPAQGGLNLKLAKMDLLQPAAVIAIQRDNELEPLLAPLRRGRPVQLIELAPSEAVSPRDQLTRQAHRAQQFSRYFSDARTLSVAWDQLAIFPGPVFAYNQLVALEDSAGFVRGLGILRQADFQKRSVVLHTPLASLADVSALRLGDLAVDPRTYRDQRVTG